MDTMDLKGIAWVGNIYQKFETMCLEVEEAVCKETAKYVENQVQTVGASMKRFCSDVMEDLLPPSSKDPSKVASADLLLNPYLEFGIYKKPISSVKEDAKDPVCNKDVSEDKSNSGNVVWDDWSAASFNWEISDNDEASCDRTAMKAANEATECESREEAEVTIGDKILDASVASPASSVTLLTKSGAKKGKRSRDVSSRKTIQAEITDAYGSSEPVSQISSPAGSNTPGARSDTCGNSGLVTRLASQDSSNTPSDSCGNSGFDSLSPIESHVSADVSSKQCGDEVLFRSRKGKPRDCDPDITEEKEIPMQSEFEETCVLVDENDLCPVNPEEVASRSYKKKIRGAFLLKKKWGRKQESTRDSVDSEWELL